MNFLLVKLMKSEEIVSYLLARPENEWRGNTAWLLELLMNSANYGSLILSKLFLWSHCGNSVCNQ